MGGGTGGRGQAAHTGRTAAPRNIRLSGVRSEEPLDLATEGPLGRVELVDCSYPAIHASGGQLASLELTRCRVRATDGAALDLRGARVRTHVSIVETVLDGDIDGVGMVLSGPFLVQSSLVGDRDATAGSAIDLTDARCGGSLQIQGPTTHVRGRTNLTRARVAGLVKVHQGARLGARAATDASLDLDASDLGGGVSIIGERTRLDRHLQMLGARSRGQVRIISRAYVGRSAGGGASVLADGLVAANDVHLDRSTLMGHVQLTGAQVAGQVALAAMASVGHDVDCVSVVARSAVIGQDVVVSGAGGRCWLTGAIDLSDARVGGSVKLRPGCQVAANHFGNAVFADRLAVDGDLRIERAKTTRGTQGNLSVALLGALRIGDAVVGGSVVIRDGTTIRSVVTSASERTAGVDAEGLTVTRDVIIEGEGTKVDGSLLLSGATIGGSVLIRSGAVVATAADVAPAAALDAVGVTVAGDLTIVDGGTLVDGALSLADSTVGGCVTIRAGGEDSRRRCARVASRPRHELDLRRAHVGTLSLRGDAGLLRVDLRGCRVGELDDDPAFWRLCVDTWWARRQQPDRTMHVLLDDLDVARLPHDDAFSSRDRRTWLRHATSPHQSKRTAAGQPTYRSIARALSAAGDDHAAVTTLVEMKRRHRRWYVRWPMHAIGQGYRPVRALLALAGLVASTWVLIEVASGHQALVATDLSARCTDPRCINPFYLALDTVVPVLDLGDRAAWTVAPTRGGWSSATRFLLLVARVLGAALTGLFLIGATGRVLDRREGL